MVLMALAALFLGLVASFGSIKLGLVVAAAIGGVLLIPLPANQFLLALVILSFFVVGQLIYFGGYTQGYWIPYGLGLILFLKWILHHFQNSPRAGNKSMMLLTSLATFTVLAPVISYAVNQSPFLQAVAGGKNLVALWSVYFVIAAGLISYATILRIWKLFYWVLLFQLPLVAYQYFYVGPSRIRFGGMVGAAWDSVVGGFGGEQYGGGASGTLAFFVCLVTAYAIARYRERLAGRAITIGIIAASGVCVALAEVKVAIVFLVIVATVLLLLERSKRLLLLSAGIPVALAIGFGLLVAYEQLHYGNGALNISKPAELLERSGGYSLDPHRINFATGEMSRVAAVVHWKDEVLTRDPFHAFFGYGPGASRGQSIVGAGEAARKYPFFIDRSAATQLLWDTGLFGFVSYLLVLFVGTVQAYRLARTSEAPEEAAIFKATTVGLAMMFVMLFYGRDPLEAPALSLLVMILLGHVASRQAAEQQTHAGYGRTVSALSPSSALAG